MRRQASAMLVAMLVVSIIGAVGFGIVSLTIRQLRQQGSVAASARAYQAAEAGLEYALLQYRLDKNHSLGTGTMAADARSVVWPSTTLDRDLGNDQSFSVRTTNSYLRIGTTNCLNRNYADYTAWRDCDGLAGRTLIQLRSGDTVRVDPQNTGSRYLFMRAMNSAGSLTNGYVVITGYDTLGQVVGVQKVWDLNDPNNAVRPKNGYQTASTDLAAASWFTINYVNESASAVLLASVGVSTSSTDAGVGAVNFSTDRYLIEVIGRSGGVTGVARQLQAVVNARTNTIEALYDHSSTALGVVDYVLSGVEIVTP